MIKQTLSEFEHYLKAQKHLSRSTIANYKTGVKSFLENYDEVNQKTIDAYFADLYDRVQDKLLAKRTYNTKVNAIRNLMQFREYQDKPVYKIPKQMRTKTLPRYVDFSELLQTINEFNWIFGEGSFKKKVIVTTLLYLPLRKGDFCQLQRSNFDFKNQWLKFYIEKTDKEINIPIHPDVIPMIQLYFDKESEQTNAFNVTKTQINYIFNKISEYTGLDISPHMVRGTYAKWFLENGGDIGLLKDILGHESIASTAIYSQLKPEDFKDSVLKVYKQAKVNERKKK